MELTVCVATFGDEGWYRLARERAIPSVPKGTRWLHVHAHTLHAARNVCLETVNTEWVVYLDADDELEPGYLDAMARGTADVRGPVVRFDRGGRLRMWQPRVHRHTHDCTADCLEDGNWLVIGSAFRTQQAKDAGGWRDWPVYEDWDLFLRLYRAGASFELVKDAVYRAHVRTDSRNRGPSTRYKNQIHEQIAAS